MTRTMTIGTVLLLSLFTSSMALAAEDIPLDYQPRMEFMENSLEASHKHARYWQYGWSSFFGASAATYTALWLNADDSDDSILYSISALKSTAGMVDMLLKPHPGRHGAELLRSLPEGTFEQKNSRLDYGETVMADSAERYTSLRSWKPHLIIVGVNAVAGGLIAAFGDEGDALVSAAIGISVGEAKLWTQPSRPVDDWNQYRTSFPGQARSEGISWQLVPIAGGLALQGQF